jgi:hypothetical protein
MAPPLCLVQKTEPTHMPSNRAPEKSHEWRSALLNLEEPSTTKDFDFDALADPAVADEVRSLITAALEAPDEESLASKRLRSGEIAKEVFQERYGAEYWRSLKARLGE